MRADSLKVIRVELSRLDASPLAAKLFKTLFLAVDLALHRGDGFLQPKDFCLDVLPLHADVEAHVLSRYHAVVVGLGLLVPVRKQFFS